MLKTYATPELRIHGSIAMLTMEDEVVGEGQGTCSKDPNDKDPKGDSKPDRPEYDAWCLFSHS